VTQTNPFAVPGVFPGHGPQAALAALRLFAHDDSGQDMIEYALVASFIGLGTVAGMNGLAAKIANDMNLIVSGFNNATAGHF
jgi:pilus assembly protein Flp/PilA